MEGKQFHIRTIVVALLLFALLAAFIGNLYHLQVVKGDEYRAASTVKISNTVTVEAARGEIVDRYGRSMVSNRATYEITLNSSVMGAEAERNANLLELIHICQENGLEWEDTLPISKEAPFTYTTETPLVYTNSKGKVIFTYLGALLDALPLGTSILPDRWRTEDLEKATSLEALGEGLTAQEVIDGLREYFLIDESVSDADARALIGVLYELNLRSRSVKQTEYIFAQDVDIDVISAIKEHSLTGVNISATTVRQYNTTSAAHLLGRVGSIQSANWETYKAKGYNMNDKVGIDGMEAAFEDYLRGKSGTLIQEMSTSGKVVSESWKLDSETGEPLEPEPGYNVMSTIDLRLQEKVEQVLADTIENLANTKEKGAVIVQSVNDGGILAMASYPTYNLSEVYSSNEAYQAVVNDTRNPFTNRATSEIYYPGSTFKPLVAIAALQEGLVTPTEEIEDTGSLQLPEEEHYPYGDYHPQCWIYRQYRGTHGWENMADALRDSCNIYFYTLGHRLGIDKIDEYAAMFGLGQKTGLELSEAEGYVAGPETSKMLGQEWYGGNLLSAAIGQDNTKITMLQLSNYIATLINGGNRYETHLLKTVKSSDYSQTVYEYEAEPVEQLDLNPAWVEAVKEGMWKVANDEESTVDQYLSNLAVEVGAKTGSAQVSADENANAVFVLFAPYDDPEIVISMVVEGGASGANLASAAGEIVNYYFGSEHTMESVGTENTLIR